MRWVRRSRRYRVYGYGGGGGFWGEVPPGGGSPPGGGGVVALVKALGTDPMRERALLVAAGLSPIAVTSWDDSLAVGYLVTIAAPFLAQIAVLARRAIAANQTGADSAVCDGQA